MKPFLTYRADGRVWPAGSTIWGLLSAWNHATNPALPMGERDHHQARRYARAIKARMDRLGMRYGVDYRELMDGSLWPLSNR